MALGIIDQALFVGTYIRLQLRDALLQKVAGRAGEFGFLFQV